MAAGETGATPEIRARWVWTGARTLEDGAVAFAGGQIAAVRAGGAVGGRRLALPGMVNAHSHAFQRAFRGHVQWRPAGRDDFWSWRDRMYAVANALDPDGVEAVTALAFLEMAEAGFTTVGEFHYLHHRPDGVPYGDPDELAQRVIAAANRVGIRLVLLRVAYARAGVGQPLRDDQRRFGDRDPDDVLRAIERLRRAHPEVRVGLAPHSVRAVPVDWLRAFAGFDGPVHAHVSEQPAENEACAREHGASPTAVFAAAGLVSPRFTAVHLTHPCPGDVDLLAAAGAAVCACPSTELDLGDGFLPVDARLRLRTCLGTDSHAAIDPWRELRDLEAHARGLAGRRNVLAPDGERDGLAERLLRAGSVEGARALGGGGEGIEAGAPADVVVLDLDRPAADGAPPLASAAFVAGPDWVDEVWVAGRRIVAGGRHMDREAIRAAAARYLPR
jgi:formimidoylglutamate deiminase